MNRVVLLHWKSDLLQAFVLRGSAANLELEGSFDLSQEETSAEIGRRLTEKLESYSPGRAKLIVAVDRELLDWQHLSLPPCPDDDLPDLVRLQADYVANGSDDPTGFDFLPLVGDEHNPHQVWTVSLLSPQLTRLRKVLSVAELEPAQVVPAVLGWKEWSSTRHGSTGGSIFIAPYGNESAIWATVNQRVVLFRQLHLPDSSSEQFDTALVSEVRRTLLAFNQQRSDLNERSLVLVSDGSDQATQLQESLNEKLNQDITLLQGEIVFSNQKEAGIDSLPLAGLAAAALAGRTPLVDLHNPRQRPAPKTRRQTYYLAAAAALALVALVGFQTYRNLQAPLDRSAEMQAQIDLLNENKDSLSEAEKNATAIRTWLSKSVNLLDELQIITQQVRPEPLDSENFPKDDDVVIGKIELRNRQYTITAYTKQNSDLQPVEYRLRDGIHRVRRGATQQSDEIPGYPIQFESIVDVLSGGSADVIEGGNP